MALPLRLFWALMYPKYLEQCLVCYMGLSQCLRNEWRWLTTSATSIPVQVHTAALLLSPVFMMTSVFTCQ